MKSLTAVYAATTFLSAFLLFLIEPMVARQLLPLFGGSAAVWTACLVFFQCALLAGYCYAHLLASALRPRSQAIVHLGLLVLSALSLSRLTRPAVGAGNLHPAATLLWLLTFTIGLPFFTLASTTPLLQVWYKRRMPSGPAPWWLFALSNAGSLLALVVYPSLIEPRLALSRQTMSWAVTFCLFTVLCGSLASSLLRNPIPLLADRPKANPPSGPRPWLLWILLPGCGSMLLCAVTNHLGENVAAIPLLWIIPLAAYLLSFVVAFASRRAWPCFLSLRMLALTLATFAYLLYSSGTSLPLELSVPIYTLALLFACLFCHAELYRLRPSGEETTAFYLLISLGAALGSILIGVVAPNLLNANYDLALTVIVVAAVALAATWQSGVAARLVWTTALCGLTYVASVQERTLGRDSLVQVRSFYGSLRVTETHFPPQAETTRTLYHGRIQHGTQLFGDGLRTEPSSYYGHNSGIGLVLDLCCQDRPRKIGVVGLGTGTIAAYGRPNDTITFYEIDPLVERLARALFTYLRESRAQVRVVLGDARLSMNREALPRVARPSGPDRLNQLNDVIVLDAFSGDAVPVHLLTAEAIALYRRLLRPDGLIAFHISSQYLDLAPELALQARSAGMRAVLVHSDADEARGIFAADWVLMSADAALLARPEIANASRSLREILGLRLWTDDYSSLLPLLEWRGAGRKSDH